MGHFALVTELMKKTKPKLKSSVVAVFIASDNQEEIVAESIKHAKEAIALDVKDGNSWCKMLFICTFN